MKLENEITVKVNWDYKKLHEYLINNGFKLVEKFDMADIYMLPKNININKTNDLDILKNCVLVRRVNKDVKKILYKYKKFSKDGKIIKQGKVSCNV